MSEDDRILRESGVEARVARLAVPLLATLGFRLVRVRLMAQNGATLQIMAERADGTLTIEDCEAISHLLSPALDVEDPIGSAYNLEVSSPGIDRPLVRSEDFSRWAGAEAKLELAIPMDGRRRFRGQLLGIDGDKVGVRLAELGAKTVWLPLADLSDARLVLTDDLVKQSLKAQKAANALN